MKIGKNLWFAVVLIGLATQSVMAIKIKTEDGVEFEVAQDHVNYYETLKNLVEYMGPGVAAAIPLPNVLAKQWKVLDAWVASLHANPNIDASSLADALTISAGDTTYSLSFSLKAPATVASQVEAPQLTADQRLAFVQELHALYQAAQYLDAAPVLQEVIANSLASALSDPAIVDLWVANDPRMAPFLEITTINLSTAARMAELQALQCLSGIHTQLLDASKAISKVCFSPDGSLLAVGAEEGVVSLLGTSTGALLYRINAHAGIVQGLCFSPDGTMLATARGQVRLAQPDTHDVCIWNMSDGTARHTLHGHTGYVRDICFSPDGGVLATASDDTTARMWSTTTGACVKVLEHTAGARSLCFSPDGTKLAISSGGGMAREMNVCLWDTSNWTCLHTLSGLGNAQMDIMCFSPDSRWLATGGSLYRQVSVWDVQTGTCAHTIEMARGTATLCFSPNSSVLAIAVSQLRSNAPSSLILYNLHTRAQVTMAVDRSVHVLHFNKAGNILLSGSAASGKQVQLWHVHTPYVAACFFGAQQIEQEPTVGCNAISMDKDGTILAALCSGNNVQLKSIAPLRAVETVHRHGMLPQERWTHLSPNQVFFCLWLLDARGQEGALDFSDIEDERKNFYRSILSSFSPSAQGSMIERFQITLPPSSRRRARPSSPQSGPAKKKPKTKK